MDKGHQFADDSMTPSPLSVSRDKYDNEIASDRPMHENSTPGMGSFNWDAGHYCDTVKGGTEVSAPEGVDKVTVDNSRADRGKED